MERGNLSRRGFMQRSLAGLVGSGLPLWYAREVFGAAAAEAAARKVAANDRILMGAIGIGSPASRNRALYHDARRHKDRFGVQFIAACDVDRRHLDNAVAMMKKDGSESVKGYKDFRELLDNKDVSAVTIATPDHWHALVAIDALRKGKDVYCEKPLTLTIAEGQAVVRAARETGRIFQVGSQQRSGSQFRLACQLVRNGRLGKVKRVETRIGANPQSPVLPKVAPPKELDWDFWLGPTPLVDYVELKEKNHTYTRCHYEFRWWYDYSGGKMTDWGAHHNDIAQWGLGMDESGPIAVEAVGEAPPKEPNRYNCHRTFKVTYTYPGGTKLVCADTRLPDAIDPQSTKTGKGGKGRTIGHDNGILFVGEGDRWIFVNRQGITASDPKLIDEPLPPGAKQLYVSNDHMENFLSGVRTRKPCICPAEVGHRSVTVCHLGVIALRIGGKTGRHLRWDPAAEKFIGDEQANGMLRRPMRSPWRLEV